MGSTTRTAFPTRVNENWRAKIQTSKLIIRLQDHAHGKCEMTPTQIQAAKILLSKVAPDLQQQSATVVHSHTHHVRHIEINPVQVEHKSVQVIDAQAESVDYAPLQRLLDSHEMEGESA